MTKYFAGKQGLQFNFQNVHIESKEDKDEEKQRLKMRGNHQKEERVGSKAERYYLKKKIDWSIKKKEKSKMIRKIYKNEPQDKVHHQQLRETGYQA